MKEMQKIFNPLEIWTLALILHCYNPDRHFTHLIALCHLQKLGCVAEGDEKYFGVSAQEDHADLHCRLW